MTAHKKIWWVTLFVKLALAALIPLSADEAYYWVWSKFPQLSYFDHPPFVAWLFAAGSFLPTIFIRWPGVILFHLAFLFWFKILVPSFSEKQLSSWFILCLLCPLIGLGSLFVLPDLPLFFFFSGALYFFRRAQSDERPLNFILFGACLGMGFLSKYIIVIPAALFVLHLILTKNFAPMKPRRSLLVIFAGLVFCSPVLIWNYQNDFKSFYFQIHHGLAEGRWHWDWTASYIAGTLLLIFPYNLWVALKTKNLGTFELLRTMALGGFLFFLFSSFKGSVELNWPALFYPCLFAVAAQMISRRGLLTNFIYWGVAYTLIAAVAITGLSPDIHQKIFESERVLNWRELPKTYRPLYASTYQLASLMWWNSQIPVYKLRDSSRYDFYDELPQSLPSEKIFYLLKERGNNVPDAFQNAAWSIQEVQVLDEKLMVLKFSAKETP